MITYLAIYGTELTVKFVGASQCFVSAINISAVKCDKAVDFPKSMFEIIICI